MKNKEYFNIKTHSAIPKNSTDFYCGVEYEIEDIISSNSDLLSEFIIESDHSLRNNGLEFKSIPNTKEQTLQNFKLLHDTIEVGKCPFSERTSIHVHVNVSNMEIATTRQFVLSYALLEPLFLNWVGKERQENIYCVPLFYTYLPSIYHKDIKGLCSSWHKYTAFNIKPIMEHETGPGLGTIEFRHLYGTSDIRIFSTWLDILEEFYLYMINNPNFNILHEIEISSVSEIANKLVPTLVKELCFININELCKDTYIDVLLSNGGL